MAAFKIFYAWQSDRPANVCRTLIRRALDNAKKLLESELNVHDSGRPEVLIDQDTQGEAGSPSVAETIFRKIRESDAFVADLTFTETRSGKSGSPNPNVLLEYGYALHALDDQRIIGVMNEKFGNPDDLPFDLKHKRWPFRCQWPDDGDNGKTREAVVGSLSRKLAEAIRAVVQNAVTRNEDAGGLESNEPLIERMPLRDGLVQSESGKKYEFPEGAKILLGLRSKQSELSLLQTETQNIASKSLRPLAYFPTTGWSQARIKNGTAVADLSGNAETKVLFASILTRDGNLFGIDCSNVGVHEQAGTDDPFAWRAVVEKVVTVGLENFLLVAKNHLDLNLPLIVDVALEGINGHFLKVDPAKFFSVTHGPFLVDRIEDSFEVDTFAADPGQVLRPFFEKIYDEVGLQRPTQQT